MRFQLGANKDAKLSHSVRFHMSHILNRSGGNVSLSSVDCVGCVGSILGAHSDAHYHCATLSLCNSDTLATILCQSAPSGRETT